jgi:hypothetical protein
MLYRLGVRSPCINRDEHKGWVSQVNISRLVTLSRAGPRWWGGPDTRLEGGDVAIISNRWPQGFDAHVVCIINQPCAGKLLTAEYGAWRGGGALKSPRLTKTGRIGRRKVQVTIGLSEILRTSAAAGQLVDPDLPVGISC